MTPEDARKIARSLPIFHSHMTPAASEIVIDAVVEKLLAADQSARADSAAEIAELRAKVEAFKVFADDKGEPRKVLGTLPVTEDGCVAGDGANVYANIPEKTVPWPITIWSMQYVYQDKSDDFRSRPIYSTRELALAAKGGQHGK